MRPNTSDAVSEVRNAGRKKVAELFDLQPAATGWQSSFVPVSGAPTPQPRMSLLTNPKFEDWRGSVARVLSRQCYEMALSSLPPARVIALRTSTLADVERVSETTRDVGAPRRQDAPEDRRLFTAGDLAGHYMKTDFIKIRLPHADLGPSDFALLASGMKTAEVLRLSGECPKCDVRQILGTSSSRTGWETLSEASGGIDDCYIMDLMRVEGPRSTNEVPLAAAASAAPDRAGESAASNSSSSTAANGSDEPAAPVHRILGYGPRGRALFVKHLYSGSTVRGFVRSCHRRLPYVVVQIAAVEVPYGLDPALSPAWMHPEIEASTPPSQATNGFVEGPLLGILPLVPPAGDYPCRSTILAAPTPPEPPLEDLNPNSPSWTDSVSIVGHFIRGVVVRVIDSQFSVSKRGRCVSCFLGINSNFSSYHSQARQVGAASGLFGPLGWTPNISYQEVLRLCRTVAFIPAGVSAVKSYGMSEETSMRSFGAEGHPDDVGEGELTVGASTTGRRGITYCKACGLGFRSTTYIPGHGLLGAPPVPTGHVPELVPYWHQLTRMVFGRRRFWQEANGYPHISVEPLNECSRQRLIFGPLDASTARDREKFVEELGEAKVHHSYWALQTRVWCYEQLLGGLARARDRRFTAAIEAYDSAISLDPKCADAYVARGAAQANLSKLNQAMVDFERAMQLDPSHANAIEYAARTQKVLMRQHAATSPTIATAPSATACSPSAVVQGALAVPDNRSKNSHRATCRSAATSNFTFVFEEGESDAGVTTGRSTAASAVESTAAVGGQKRQRDRSCSVSSSASNVSAVSSGGRRSEKRSQRQRAFGRKIRQSSDGEHADIRGKSGGSVARNDCAPPQHTRCASVSRAETRK